jgi:hypothetical protein
MAESYKRLGAVDVAATTNTALYVVPAGKAAVISSMSVCNRNASKITFRVAHVDGAIGALANEDYIYYDIQLAANDSFEMTRGVTLSAGDTIVVQSNTANVNFIAWGSEADIA